MSLRLYIIVMGNQVFPKALFGPFNTEVDCEMFKEKHLKGYDCIVLPNRGNGSKHARPTAFLPKLK